MALLSNSTTGINNEHRQNNPSFQSAFTQDVQELTSGIRTACNPFNSDTGEMLYLNTGSAMNDAKNVSEAMRTLVQTGGELYRSFVRERLVLFSVPLTEKITRQNIMLPSKANDSPVCTTLTPTQDRKLTMKLRTVAQFRPSEVLEALKYEPENVPSTFVSKGRIYQTSKATVLPKLKEFGKTSYEPSQSTGLLVVDISMVVCAVQAKSTATTVIGFFQDVRRTILSIPGNFQRIDLVGDNYEDQHHLKENTRSTRGHGTVVATLELSDSLPLNFKKDFLRSNANKAQIYMPYLRSTGRRVAAAVATWLWQHMVERLLCRTLPIVPLNNRHTWKHTTG